ncbi:MAG: serine hydrolase [Acidobacteriota bacterium]
MMTKTRLIGVLVLVGVAIIAPAILAGSEVLPEHLAALRLQGPVLIAGQTGWPLEQRMQDLDVHGVSVAFCADGEVRWAEAWGFADVEEGVKATPETLFQAASISKPVSAAGVLRQVEKGKLALDRNVNEFLRSWKLPENEWTAEQPVTLERILSHSAGLTVHGFPGYALGAPVPTAVQVLEGEPPANTSAVRVDLEPGTRFRYSGGGTTIAQVVLTDLLGESFPVLMERTVLGPAGMASSTFEQPLPPEKLSRAAAGYFRDGSPVAGKRHTYPEMAPAGLWTTPSDLCRFAMEIQAARRGDEGALLGRPLAERMTTPLAEEAGLGFFIDDRRGEKYFGHGGANEGFQCELTASRDHGFALAVMTNSDNGGRLAREIVRAVAQREEWPGYLPAPLPVVPFADGDPAALAGRYRVHGDEAIELVTADGRLFSRSASGADVSLFQIAPGELARMDREIRYEIEREEESVRSVTVVTPPWRDRPERRQRAERMAEGERLPSDFLVAGEFERAAAAYRRLHAEQPDDPAVAESRLNTLGYTLAGEGHLDQAITVLEAAVALYPRSANTYDSLAEINLQAGNRQRALELYRRVLEVLPQDTTTTNESLRDFLRTNAEAKIRELG